VSKAPLEDGFSEHVWIATAVLRQMGRGPALVFTTPTDAPGFSHRIRPVLEKMGLRLGFDVIVYGLLEPTLDDFEFGIVSDEDEPFFDGDEPDELAAPSEAQVDEVWNAINKVRPGFVALLRDPNDDPAIPDDVRSWLNALPTELPVLQGVDDWTRRSTTASLSAHEAQVQPAAIIRRPTESHEIAAQLQRWTPQIVSITGRPGTGRSALISEVAAQLQRSEQPMLLRHFRVPGQKAVKSLEKQLRRAVANEAGVPEVIVIDDFDQIAQLETGFRAEKEFVDQIEQVCATGAVRLLIVLRDDHVDALAQASYELAERIVHVRVGELPRPDLEDIVRQQTDLRLSAAGLELTDDLLNHALSPSTMPSRLGQPSLAINRIETALARARLRHGRVLTRNDFVLGPTQTSATSSSNMRASLRERIRGQKEAVDTIVDAVTPAMSGLKLCPDRPHAVLLFAGPSGVGKTEAAKQLAKAAYGSDKAVVRLDMSEYANEEDARMKLIGASRIWKGSSTSGLLTTKVIERPRCLVLLDEFEKAI
jgi:ATP-dependent Clp protease ATP-binding subunit ClpA